MEWPDLKWVGGMFTAADDESEPQRLMQFNSGGPHYRSESVVPGVVDPV